MTSRRAIARRVLVYASKAIVALLSTFALGVLISPIGFYLNSMARGRVKDESGFFSVHHYTSTYFINVWFSSSQFHSPERANEVLAEDLKSVVKVIEIGPKHNREGRLVGQRAVAIVLDRLTNKYCAAVFWTDGRYLFAIASSSATHVMQFERYRAPSLVGSTR